MIEPNKWEAEKVLRKHFNRKVCLAPKTLIPQCSGEIVKAHTIPKSVSLKRIARDGHVYGFSPSLAGIAKSTDRKIRPQLIGINEASTFSGFCRIHDDCLFAPLEKVDFIGTPEQCFLLGYRSLSRDLYCKEAQIASLEFAYDLYDKTILQDDPVFQTVKSATSSGHQAASMDNIHFKTAQDNILTSRDFDKVSALVIEFEKAPSVMCSSSVYPYKDWEGNVIQHIADLSKTPEIIHATSFCTGSCGAVVFSWLKDNDAVCLKFIKGLVSLPEDQLTDGIIRFIFSYSENVFMEPNWWEGLSENSRHALIQRLFIAGSMEPTYYELMGDITDDNLNYDHWGLKCMKTVGW